jgi:transposase
MERVRKHRQLSGAERERLLVEVARLYASGASIRAIAEVTGRGYGTVQRMLREARVEPRGRGGAHRVGE